MSRHWRAMPMLLFAILVKRRLNSWFRVLVSVRWHRLTTSWHFPRYHCNAMTSTLIWWTKRLDGCACISSLPTTHVRLYGRIVKRNEMSFQCLPFIMTRIIVWARDHRVMCFAVVWIKEPNMLGSDRVGSVNPSSWLLATFMSRLHHGHLLVLLNTSRVCAI